MAKIKFQIKKEWNFFIKEFEYSIQAFLIKTKISHIEGNFLYILCEDLVILETLKKHNNYICQKLQERYELDLRIVFILKDCFYIKRIFKRKKFKLLCETKGIPHKGWFYDSIEDNGTADFICEFCGKEEIRYIHYLFNNEIKKVMSVGCVCAENLTNDYINPRKRQKLLEVRHTKIYNFFKKYSKTNAKNNICVKYKEYSLTIFKNKSKGGFTTVLDNNYNNFTNLNKAKLYSYNFLKDITKD